MVFGEKLKKMRKENELSQEQLAEKLNVTRQAVSKWESGALPDVDNIVKISTFFDCSLDYLMSNKEEIEEEGFNEIKEDCHRNKWKVPWDIKWLLACAIPLSVLLVLWSLANASDVLMKVTASTEKSL